MTSRADIAAGKGLPQPSTIVVIKPSNALDMNVLVSCPNICKCMVYILVIVAFALSTWSVVRLNEITT